MVKHRSDNVESNALWSICIYTYLRNIGPPFPHGVFLFSKVWVLVANFDGLFALAYLSHVLWYWPIGRTWYHHTSLSSTLYLKGCQFCPTFFLEWESWSQPYQVFSIAPQLDHVPKYSIRFGYEVMWRKVWQGVVFMEKFWNFKAIVDTEIIFTSIQSKLILKKFKWFLWRGFQKWWKLFVLLLVKIWNDILLVKRFKFQFEGYKDLIFKAFISLPENRRKPTELPMEFFRRKFLLMKIISSQNLSIFTDIYKSSAIRSVSTDEIRPLVYTDRIADERYSFFGKLQRCDDMDFFKQFYGQNYWGIQTGIVVQWRGTSTGGTCPSVIPSVKASIYPLCRHSLPLFLLLLPHPTSPLPNCSQPPVLTLPSSQHKHSSFLYFCTWSQHPFLWILSFFVSKSILFSFNI